MNPAIPARRAVSARRSGDYPRLLPGRQQAESDCSGEQIVGSQHQRDDEGKTSKCCHESSKTILAGWTSLERTPTGLCSAFSGTRKAGSRGGNRRFCNAPHRLIGSGPRTPENAGGDRPAFSFFLILGVPPVICLTPSVDVLVIGVPSPVPKSEHPLRQTQGRLGGTRSTRLLCLSKVPRRLNLSICRPSAAHQAKRFILTV